MLENVELRILVNKYFKKEKFTKEFSKAKVIEDFKKTILVERLTKQEMIYGDSNCRKLI